ncbi:MAG: small ribosomal subunit biogenesis GTPase RsgA, partial [Candidatus Regiella insecticola]|nr:small ribosomal subunit biogenesis GTPase RsgA [Candidatus Regiella insecticola]
MSKNKLSRNQPRRVQANHQRRLRTADKESTLDDALFGAPQPGIVVSRFGQHADVEDKDGIQYRCNIR